MARQRLMPLSSMAFPAIRFRSIFQHPLFSLPCVRRNACTSNRKKKEKGDATGSASLKKETRRTRSHREFDVESIDQMSHVPVMLGEVLDVFSPNYRHMSVFVDCTLGAAGHSSAVIQAHPQLKIFIGMDVDPGALDMARRHISTFSSSLHSDVKTFTFLNNFRNIKSVLGEVDLKILDTGVDGILMDLGMSSMQVNNRERGFSVLHDGPLDMRMDLQASLKAEDILNYWPDSEVGRILREYGEESNWRFLVNKIIQARLRGGLHSTGELVDLIRSGTYGTKSGRQGWIKTATRVFQALRIAVNDELNILSDTLDAAFDCLAPGGRLAVISFHSLEDRIVKQTFLQIIDCDMENGYADAHERDRSRLMKMRSDGAECEKESWIKQTVHGLNGTILTRRPITPSAEEEKLNRRSRSAKLRVIQKGVS